MLASAEPITYINITLQRDPFRAGIERRSDFSNQKLLQRTYEHAKNVKKMPQKLTAWHYDLFNRLLSSTCLYQRLYLSQEAEMVYMCNFKIKQVYISRHRKR